MPDPAGAGAQAASRPARRQQAVPLEDRMAAEANVFENRPRRVAFTLR
jgi:hypothetical protein